MVILQIFRIKANQLPYFLVDEALCLGQKSFMERIHQLEAFLSSLNEKLLLMLSFIF